ncbi:hypothetical protein [Persephonella sp.]|uniref:hypothetical protein n=1 Tax=Persephonella sp. TaxID=2060922 RepID=UPI00261E31F8|nr:hypothetical protein [Persephonella sp.]
MMESFKAQVEDFNSFEKEEKIKILEKLTKAILVSILEDRLKNLGRKYKLKELLRNKKLDIIDEILKIDENFSEEEFLSIVEILSGSSLGFSSYLATGEDFDNKSKLEAGFHEKFKLKDELSELEENAYYRKEVRFKPIIDAHNVPRIEKDEQIVHGIKLNRGNADQDFFLIITTKKTFAQNFIDMHIKNKTSINPSYKQNLVSDKTAFFITLLNEFSVERINRIDVENERGHIKNAIFKGDPWEDPTLWEFIMERGASITGVRFESRFSLGSNYKRTTKINIEFHDGMLKIGIPDTKLKPSELATIYKKSYTLIIKAINNDSDEVNARIGEIIKENYSNFKD